MTTEARSIRRPAASFKVRRRSLSPKRQAEFDTWIATWGLEIDGTPLDWAEVFGRTGDVVLDVGFGHGESTIAMAAGESRRRRDRCRGAHPRCRHRARCDRAPGTASDPSRPRRRPAVSRPSTRRVTRRHPRVLPRPVDEAPQSPSAAHSPRRGRRPGRPTAAGGFLHLATDIADYAESMQSVCDAEPRLTGGVVERPDWRPLTRFEQRGLDAGRRPVDLLYTRTT